MFYVLRKKKDYDFTFLLKSEAFCIGSERTDTTTNI